MFCFLHAADLHLDSPLRGLSRHDEAPAEAIRGATRRALENLVDLALEKRVAFVLIAGDLFDGDQRDYATALFFNRQMTRLREGGIPVYLIRGNHDAEAVITKSLAPPENVTLFPVGEARTVQHPDLPVALHGQSFATAAVSENLVPGYPAAQSGCFNIGLLHTSLAGSAVHDTYAPCTVSDLEGKDYQYWALGHIHQPEVISEDPWIVYSGNLQGRKVNESGARGCFLVEVDDALRVSGHHFIALDVVRWRHLEVDVNGVEGEDALLEKISRAFAKARREAGERLLALRLTLRGATPLHGELHANLGRWQAQCRSIAGDLEGGEVWFERLAFKTRPTYSLEELARRDDLTALVLAALDDFDAEEKPAAVAALEGKLPAAALAELDRPNAGSDLKEEVAAIVLHGIATSS